MLRKRGWRSWWPALIAFFGAGLALGLFYHWTVRPTAEQSLFDARAALARGRWADAQRLAQRVPRDSTARGPAMLVAGEAATKLGNWPAALEAYSQVPDDGSDEGLAAIFSAAGIQLQLGQLSLAEAGFRRVLDVQPDFFHARTRLVYLLGMVGRRWEAAPHLLELIRQDRFSADHLLLLGNPDGSVELREELEKARRDNPTDPLPLLGQLRIALTRHESREAKSLVERVLSGLPNLVEAHVCAGEVLGKDAPRAAFLNWNAKLPPHAEDHPGIWLIRGQWSQAHGEPRAAVRCYWEAIRLDPNQRAANYQLGQLLTDMHQPVVAAAFLDRAKQLHRIIQILELIFANRNHLGKMEEAAALLESLGRFWESWGWCRAALALAPNLPWAGQRMERLQPRLVPDVPQTVPDALPTAHFDLSTYPLPEWDKIPDNAVVSGPLADSANVSHEVQRPLVRFEDRAQAAGIDFTFFNGHELSATGARMFEFTGGGVAVLDFDGDGWPDLYLTQGCVWPPQPGQRRHLDRLYRNLGNGRFADVSAEAELDDDRYSQGCSVGDFDNDGFADLSVANIGTNRLYRNNGDGTFQELPEIEPLRGNHWTTSCVIADLNADGLPDLYDVNYLEGDDVFDRICEVRGVPKACSPTIFPGAPDVALINLGDGRFARIAESAGLSAPDGNGLGIIAADFDDSSRLSLFVANDSVANFLFLNQTGADHRPAFSEQALAQGLAFSGAGKAQASMGAAVGDANGDGLFDLFKTNFFREGATLYLQQPGGAFSDETQAAGLLEPTFLLLGFGTQFLDGELDGWPDLVIANGHVDEFHEDGATYQMRPQYFRNGGQARFRELPGSELGPYFEGKYLGRGLARLDWNRDGREDFAVSQINSPAALVTNATPGAGRYVAIQLIGVQGARDAIGAVVRLTAGERQWVRQLTAGDGYQASNERELIFGLGSAESIDRVEVRWPSGAAQTFENLTPGNEWLLIEGRRQATQVTAPDR